MRPALRALLLLPLIAGCATLPVLRDRPEPQAMQGAYPTLMPIDEALAAVPPPPATDPAASVAARAAALRARAAALRARGPAG